MSKIRSYFYRPKSNAETEKPKRWNIPAIIWRAIKKTCTVLGAMILLSALLSTCAVMMAGSQGGSGALPDDMVLVLPIEQDITETQTRPSLMDPFPFMQPTLRTITQALHQAKSDDRVRGVIFSMKGGNVNISHAEELIEAIDDFKQSGKFTKIYAPSYADGAGGLVHYMLASAFDEIWMQPVGMVSIAGLNFEMPFAKNALEKIGVSAQFVKREEFKSAMENFTNETMSEQNREMLVELLNNWSQKITGTIAENREIKVSELNALINKGLLTGGEALEGKLIDRLEYADRIRAEIQKDATGNEDDQTIEFVDLGSYAAKTKETKTYASNIALVKVIGTIVDSDETGRSAGASEINTAIHEAIDDETVKAIVVRIDSPGGSPSASETIRRALERAKAKEKPVVVSMGPSAASGGYWIAAEGNRVYATSGTLTGSIGVVMGKFELSGLWEKLGVNWQGPQVGSNADLWSINEPFDPQALARMNDVIDETYEAFLARVAKGRTMPIEQVRAIAKGRVYTGERAKELGLVDEIGGLNFSLDMAAKMMGAPDRHSVGVLHFPRDKTGIERFLELFGQEVSLPVFMQSYFGSNNAFSEVAENTQAISDEMRIFEESPIAVYEPIAAIAR